MKTKKITALVMSGVMTLALAAPAFAANSTKITGAYEEVEIDVTLQDTGKAIINPYSMPYKVKSDDTSADIGVLSTAGQIATQPLVMYNKSEVALDVGATVSAVVPKTSKMELIASAVKDNATDKQAQVYLELKRDKTLQNTDINTGAASATHVCGVTGTTLLTAFNNWSAKAYDKAATDQVLVSTDDPVTKEKLAVMSAGKKVSNNMEAQAGGFVLYRLAGNVTKNPETPWDATDTFEVNVAFSFSPYEAVEGGTIALSSGAAKYTAPAGVTTTGATYKWEILTGGTSNADTATGNTDTVTPKAGTNTASAGTVNLKCTMTLTDGTSYFATGSITLT